MNTQCKVQGSFHAHVQLNKPCVVGSQCVCGRWPPRRSGRKKGKKREFKWQRDGRRMLRTMRAPTFAWGTSDMKCRGLAPGGRNVLLVTSEMSSRPHICTAPQVLARAAASLAASSIDIALAYHLSRLPSPPRITHSQMLHFHTACSGAAKILLDYAARTYSYYVSTGVLLRVKW